MNQLSNEILKNISAQLIGPLKGVLKKKWGEEYREKGREEASRILRRSIKRISIITSLLLLSILLINLASFKKELITKLIVTISILFLFLILTIYRQIEKLQESPLSSGKKIKSIENIETALGSGEEGVPFKLGWLNKKDVQQIVRRDEVDELKKFFKKHRAILLEGPPASGKTVIAKQFGLEMARKGYFVYYANLTVRRGLGNNVTPETLPNELKEELLGNLNVDIYVIIEDIHNYLNEYDAMNWTADSKKKIKLLLVSRPIREHVFTGERKLKSKKTEQFSWTYKFGITADQVLPLIVEKAQKSKGIKVNNIWNTKEFVKGNLYLLIFAIKAAEETGKPLDAINKNDIREQVGDYIFGKGKPFKSLLEKVSEKFGNRQLSNTQKNEFKEILKFLSVISQYELPVSGQTLAKYLGLSVDDVENYLVPLVNYGDIVKIECQDFINNSYMVPHSKLAESMADVLIKQDTPHDKNYNNKKLEILRFYLKQDDYPGTLIYRVMHGEDKELSKLLLSYLDESDFADIKNRELDIIEISFILYALGSSKVSKKFIETIGNEIRSISFSKQSLSKLGFFLAGLSNVDKNLTKEIVNQHNNEISISFKNSDINDIGYFIWRIAWVNEEVAKEIIRQHKKELISISFKNSDIKDIGDFIWSIARVNEEVAKEIIRQHKKELISISFKNSDIK